MSNVFSEYTLIQLNATSNKENCVFTDQRKDCYNTRCQLNNDVLIFCIYPYVQNALCYRYIGTFSHWNVVLTIYPSRVIENNIFTVFSSC